MRDSPGERREIFHSWERLSAVCCLPHSGSALSEIMDTPVKEHGNDAFHMTAPLPTGDSCIRAIRGALDFAKVNPEQIDYINAHASSTQLNDANEALCIQKIFNGQAKQVPVSGTKAYYGHPLGASAAIEGVVCALAIRDGLIPPTLNYQTHDPACALDVVPNEPREKTLNYVVSNAFGFGGINSCVVYRKV